MSFYKNHRKGLEERSPLSEVSHPAEWLRVKMRTNAWYPPEPWLTPRSLAERAGPWDERLMRDNDGDYFCRVIEAAETIRHVPESVIFYRRAVSGSISSDLNLNAEKLQSLSVSLQRHVRLLQKLDSSPAATEASVIFLKRWLYFFWPEMGREYDALQALLRELGCGDAEPELPGKFQKLTRWLGWRRSKQWYFRRPRFGDLKAMIKEGLRSTRY